MSKTNAATKLAPKKAPARAKTLKAADRATAQQVADQKREAMLEAARVRARAYHERQRALRAATAAAAPDKTPAPAKQLALGISKAQLVATLETHLVAYRTGGEANAPAVSALETALQLAKLLRE
jgi:hypothetical protein